MNGTQAPGPGGSTLVVARDRTRLGVLVGLVGVTAVAGVGHLALGRRGGRPGQVAAAAVVVAAGAGLGRVVSESGWDHPALVLTEEALHDHASGASVGRLPWRTVTGVGVRHLPGSHVLQLQVADEHSLLRGLNPLSRAVVELNRRVLGAPVNVPLAACALGPAQLRAEVEARVRRAHGG